MSGAAIRFPSKLRRWYNVAVHYYPRHFWKTYPEQFIFFVAYAIPGLSMAAYKLPKYWNERVWYTNNYTIYRVDDQPGLNARKPDEYPARWETVRENWSGLTWRKDY